VAERTRKLRGWERTVERFAASPAGGWYFINVANKVDKHLVPATDGRLSTAIGQQVLVVETTGARSGARRRIPLVYVTDGAGIVLIASKGGAPKNPAWYHNLKAHPDIEIERAGKREPMTAHQADAAERAELWPRITDMYPGYDDYQARTDREIPVMVCAPRSP
jgi:deazaflavin-dependent oxidoreductase (nitroreductase family)